MSPKIEGGALQGLNLPCSSHLCNLASGHGFAPNAFVFLFTVTREPDHGTLWRPAPSAFLSSTGEVRILRMYFYFPPSPSVPAYRYFCARDCLSGGPLLALRASGWITYSVQVVVPTDELRR